MNARWMMAATLVAVVVATLVLAGAAAAQSQRQTENAFPGEVTHIDETYVDPYFSEVCGFTVVQHDVGVNKISVFVTGPEDKPMFRLRDHISIRQTVTNPETGTSVTVQTSGSATELYKPLDDRGYTQEQGYLGSLRIEDTFMGLNFLVKGLKAPDGTAYPSASGRGVVWIQFIVDENGNVVDFSFGEEKTPHLEHIIGSGLEAAICDTLAQ